MIVIKNYKKIDDYQVDELYTNNLFVNKYDLDLKYNYELDINWKEFAFDLIAEMYKEHIHIDCLEGTKANLLTFIKNNYKMLIAIYKLKIDFNDYIELNDYITIQEWESMTNHFVVCGDNFYLVEIK